jgi:hypothetical protein
MDENTLKSYSEKLKETQAQKLDEFLRDRAKLVTGQLNATYQWSAARAGNTITSTNSTIEVLN